MTTIKTSACIICHKSNVQLRRGLCPSHYANYDRAKEIAVASGFSEEDFDARLISQGLLKADARHSTNPFVVVLEELKSERQNQSVKNAADSTTPGVKQAPITELEVGILEDDVEADAAPAVLRAAAKDKQKSSAGKPKNPRKKGAS
jgi:hypothetical protein